MIDLAILLFGLILLLLSGVPVAISIMSISIIYMAYSQGVTGISYRMVAQRIMYGVNNFTILAIPLFLFTGYIMNEGGVTDKLFGFANVIVGSIPGGLGHANVIASIIFAGMSGSAVADASGLGTIQIEAMNKEGFDTKFSAAITAASSTIGPIFPPSIPAVMVAVLGGVSVSRVLIGGVLPAFLMAISLMIMIFIMSKSNDYPRREIPSIKEIILSFKEAFLPILTPVILIGGIISGNFTATEAAAMSCLYSLILCMAIYRRISFKKLWDISIKTMKASANILFIIAASSLYGFQVVRAQIPAILADFILNISDNPTIVILLIVLFLLIIGMFLESLAAITILSPILFPIVTTLGIDPLHFAVLMNLTLMMGLITPPLGMCLYAVSNVAEIPFKDSARAVIPFYIPLLITVLIIAFFPWVVTVLPTLFL